MEKWEKLATAVVAVVALVVKLISDYNPADTQDKHQEEPE